ncbi:MAG TPA: fumarate hydratase C-terminal domain-containing protein, partial [Candidatus Binatia bacterium]|nr:fumarate hydratase C-terminal domain-containing protein [Candidatus Binatia bacterium]
MASYTLTTPISDDEIHSLRAGDTVFLNGIIVTARDAAHKFMMESFIKGDPREDESGLYETLKTLLDGGVIYHCGPVVQIDSEDNWHFVAAGPTTSIREEVYEPDVIHHFNLKGVVGKGGMGPNTLAACAEQPAVYFHAIGGAASLIAQTVERVLDVHKLAFGVPEAMWVIRVKEFPVVVTMD